MNERQRRFCEYYAQNPNATEAAKSVGYSEKTAYSIGQRLLKNVEVIGYIRRLQDESAKARLLSVVRVKAYLSSVIEDQTEKTADRLKAADMYLRAAGQFVHIQQKDKDEWSISSTTNDDGAIILLPPINPDPDFPEGMEVII